MKVLFTHIATTMFLVILLSACSSSGGHTSKNSKDGVYGPKHYKKFMARVEARSDIR